MFKALTGRKVGMTRLFEESGRSLPISVVRLDLARYIARKTKAKDGYDAVCVACGVPTRGMKRPQVKYFEKMGAGDCGRIVEFRTDGVDENDYQSLEPGGIIDPTEVFKEGDAVDVIGFAKGKGFAGTIKRFNFSTQDASHGNSLSHRIAGTTGQNQLPGRVFPGKKMPGHHGNQRVCMQNLKIVGIVAEDRVLLIKGSIPGGVNGKITVRKSNRI